MSDANLEIFNEMTIKNDPKLVNFLTEDISELVKVFNSASMKSEF